MTKEERMRMAQERLEAMQSSEIILRKSGFRRIAGVDEVGRGPLAGPVVAAAVILPEDVEILLGINDSKKLTPKKRELMFEEITKIAVDFSLGMVSPEEIDRINILEATKKAMAIAVSNLSSPPDHVLIDALELPTLSIPQTSIIKGDSASVSIAAASIIAKVTRDRIMQEYDEIYPGYGFRKHKGYGTSMHCAAIRANGPSPIHRKTFLKRI